MLPENSKKALDVVSIGLYLLIVYKVCVTHKSKLVLKKPLIRFSICCTGLSLLKDALIALIDSDTKSYAFRRILVVLKVNFTPVRS